MSMTEQARRTKRRGTLYFLLAILCLFSMVPVGLLWGAGPTSPLMFVCIMSYIKAARAAKEFETLNKPDQIEEVGK